MKYRILRTFLCLSLLCLLLLACALPALAEDEGEEPPVITSGNSIVIYNVETDTFLFENDGTRSLAPTVVSKLMTAMIAADHYESLSAKVTVAAEALRDIGAAGDISAPRLGLTAGSEMTVEDLLCATLVSSANDAACALAYDISGGDMAAFVEEMNRRAEAIGASDTHFTSPAGVYSDRSHTTARDAARIAGAFYNYNRLLEISSLPYYQLGNTMHTKNYLLSEALMKGCTLAGVKGIAAGQAKADGEYCLITAAESEALTYIFVVMDAAGENRYNDGTRDFPAENAYNDVKKAAPVGNERLRLFDAALDRRGCRRAAGAPVGRRGLCHRRSVGADRGAAAQIDRPDRRRTPDRIHRHRAGSAGDTGDGRRLGLGLAGRAGAGTCGPGHAAFCRTKRADVDF